MGMVNLDPVTGCWLWAGELDESGYARYGGELAHRMVFALMLGKELPPGVAIDHVCRRRHCIRPAHLDPVSKAENERRKTMTRRVPVRCPIDHLMGDVALHGRTPEGGAFCRACLRQAIAEQPVVDWLEQVWQEA